LARNHLRFDLSKSLKSKRITKFGISTFMLSESQLQYNLGSRLSKMFLIISFILLYAVNAGLGWPIVEFGGLRIEEYVDLAAILQSGQLCSGKIGFWQFIDLFQPLSEKCGGFLYGRPLLAILAVSSIPLAWTTSLAVAIGLTAAILLALLFTVDSQLNKSKFSFAILASFSPGVFLLYERSNFDLLMLIGIVAATYLWKKGFFYSGLIVIGITAIMKYYTVPFLLVAPLLFARSRKQIALGLVLSVLIAIYAFWDYSRLTGLPDSGYNQFGSAVLPHYFSHIGLDVPRVFLIGFGVLMPTIVGLWIFCSTTIRDKSLILGKSIQFTNIGGSVPFISVSIVFVTCFFAGLNFDYRLVFLVIPGVVLLQSANGPRLKLLLLSSSLLLALWGSAGLGSGIDFGSDLARFLLVGLLQLAGDTMVFIWTGVLMGLVARIYIGSDLKNLMTRGAS
jgi:hypothetical protein